MFDGVPVIPPAPPLVLCPTCGGTGWVQDIPVHSAPARTTDPETSQAAAHAERDVRRFSARSLSGRLLVQFSRLDLTDQEAALRVSSADPPSRFEACRRRCSDLRAAGYLVDSGFRRQNQGSPDEAIVWTLSPGGALAADRLAETGWTR